nr:hypothetical protein SHINE37_80014 [Rhizobiaceae bacterium]
MTCRLVDLMAYCGSLRADHGQKHDPSDEIIIQRDLTDKGPLQKHYFGRILGRLAFLGFPRRGLRDSWVVGFLEGRPWTSTGSPILRAGLRPFSLL